MKIKEIKALARETLLDSYHKLILAKLLASLLSLILVLLSGVLLLFTMVNLGFFTGRIKQFFPSFTASRPAAVIGVILLTALLIFTVIFGVWVEFGYTKLLLHIARGQKASTADILYGFHKDAHPWKVLWTSLLSLILIAANLILPALLQAIAVVCGYVPEKAAENDPWSIAILVVTVLAVLWMIYETFAFAFADTIVIDDPEIDVLDAIRKSMKISRGNKLRMLWLCTFSFLFWGFPLEIVPIIGLWVKPYIEMTLTLFYLSLIGDLKENPACRELFRNEFAEKIENRVVAHVEDRKQTQEKAAEKQAELREEIPPVKEAAETGTEAGPEAEARPEAEAGSKAERPDDAATGAAETAEATGAAETAEATGAAETVAATGAVGAAGVAGAGVAEAGAVTIEEEPIQHFPMGRVHFNEAAMNEVIGSQETEE